MHVRAVEREAVGEALAVVRQQLVEEVEHRKAWLGFDEDAQVLVEERDDVPRLVEHRRHRVDEDGELAALHD